MSTFGTLRLEPMEEETCDLNIIEDYGFVFYQAEAVNVNMACESFLDSLGEKNGNFSSIHPRPILFLGM